MKKDILNKILIDQEAKTPLALLTDINSGEQTVIYHKDAFGPEAKNSELLKISRRNMQDNKNRIITVPKSEFFLHVFNPPLRLAIVGAVHIAQPLTQMAKIAGYDVIVVDPRESFATADRFPNTTIITEWPDDALEQIHIDRRTAIVTLTHDPKLDDPALSLAIESDAFYIGALGSKTTHASRVDRLKSEGFDEKKINRIHGPVGLNLHAVSPSEIAISILAEITATLHAQEKKAKE